ncbi:MAG: class I SAM-dependent methyltransferase, partial [Desulfamplus sp.]|nr:class I SAM-dependent methyltransferase [Desulfamplus sp.]
MATKSGIETSMFDNTSFYSEHGNLSYEFDDEHQDHELAAIEFDLLSSHLKHVETALHLFCGAGRHLAAFARNGIQSIGIDISPFLTQQACNLINMERPRLRAPAYNVVGDALYLPFAENHFECVTALGNSISLLSDDQINQFFYQAGRVMKTEGIFILDIPDFEQMKNGQTPLTTTINTSRNIYSKNFGNGVLNWHRFHDQENNRICSIEEIIFHKGSIKGKKIQSHFFFHIIVPDRLRCKAKEFNL